MPTDSTIPFDRLTAADFHVGAIYLGGTKGRAVDDLLAKLLPVGNQSGFRPHEPSSTRPCGCRCALR